MEIVKIIEMCVVTGLVGVVAGEMLRRSARHLNGRGKR